MSCTSNIVWVWSAGKNIKKWDASNRIQNQSIKKILQLAATSSTWLLMEIGKWPAKERIEYSADVNP